MRPKIFSTLLVSTLTLLHSAQLLAQQTQQPTASAPPWGSYGPGHMWGFGWGFWWAMPIMMLLFFITCALILWFLFGRRGVGGSHHWAAPWHMMDGPWSHWRDPTHSALQILNERYAKGEINKAEYEERRRTILSGIGR